MTLQDDCELWVTFDSEDVNPQRGIAYSRYGNVNKLDASGGPTYGQPSPVGEAVGFDGTDDFFDVDFNRGLGEATIFTLVKPDGGITDSDGRQDVFSEDPTGAPSGQAFVRFASGGDFGIRFITENGNEVRAKSNRDSWGEKYYRFIITISSTDGVARVLNGDKVLDITTFSDNVELFGTSTPITIGSQRSGNAFFFDGAIAATALWSRVLSDAEIDELNRMTDRMVSKL